MQKDPVYITGHRNPDSDSIAAAVAYAFFKRSLGIRAIPCRLGALNAESRYLLERFSIPEPQLLTDARITVGELSMDPPDALPEDATIFEALQKMQACDRTYSGIVDSEGRLVGMLTKSDISVVGLYDTAQSTEILSHTSVEKISKTLSGQIIYQPEQWDFSGNVSVVTMTQPDKLDNYNVAGCLVVCGDQPETQKKMIEKGASMIVVVWGQEIAPEVLETAKAHNCPVVISGKGATNTIRYLYFSPPVSRLMKRKLICFNDQELAEDVGRKMLQSRHRVYPVLDSQGRPLGYVARYHIMQAINKQIILVDHNEFSQSVRAIEKARVLEVVDHHRICDFSSSSPVQFRNEIVGSTSTIVATIFRENQIPIPQNLAGLLLGAILSDTLNFHSPTTTQKDIATSNILAAIANLDVEEFAEDLFRQTAANGNLSVTELIRGDLKFFDVGKCRLSISQVIIPSMSNMLHSSAELQEGVDSFAKKKNLDLAVLAITSVLNNGSILFFGGPRSPWGKEAFPDNAEQDMTFHEGILSRKGQILPKLTQCIQRYI